MGSLKTYAPTPHQTTETKSAPVSPAPKQAERQPEMPPSPAALLQLTAQGNGGNSSQHSRTILNAQRHYGNRAIQRLVNRNVLQVQRKSGNEERCTSCQQAAASQNRHQVPEDFDGATVRQQDVGSHKVRESDRSINHSGDYQKDSSQNHHPENHPTDRQTEQNAHSIDPSLRGGRIPIQPPIQRKSACGACAKSPEEEEELQRTLIQRKAADFSGTISNAIQDIDRSKGGGQPLDSNTREFMESRFDEDFRGVRVHADHQANQWAKDLNAHAFTTGQDIFFAPGKYAPATDGGKHLLAHELTHVVQQQGGRVAADMVDTPGDRHEQEADLAAQAILEGKTPTIQQNSTHLPTIQRDATATPVGTNLPPQDDTKFFNAGSFKIPPQKGAKAKGQYNSKLPIGTRSSAGTSTLRNLWVEKQETVIKNVEGDFSKKVSTKPGEKKTDGKEPSPLEKCVLDRKLKQCILDSSEFPKGIDGNACEVDHIRESALGGPDASGNFQLMSKSRNASLGGLVLKQFTEARQKMEQFNADPNNANKQKTEIQFTPPPEDAELLPGDECMSTDDNFEQWLRTKLQAKIEGKEKGEEADIFPLQVGGTQIPIDLKKATKAGDQHTGDISAVLRGKSKGSKTRGLELEKFNLKQTDGSGTIQGGIRPNLVAPLQPKENAPINLPVVSRKLTYPAGLPYKAEFPKLSEATFNFTMGQNDDVEGKGELKPTKPILNKTVIKLSVKDGQMSASLQIPVGQVNLPVPGLTLGGEGFTVGFENRQFFASGKITLQYGTVAKGDIEAKVTGGGFSASGKIDLTIPGLDKATGEVWVREDGKLGGRITVGADKLKLPGVKSANLVVTIQDGQLAGEGTVQLAIPGIKEGRLGFGVDQAGNYNITGTAQLSVPGLDEATVGLAYKNGDLEGTGKVGFKVPGLEGAGAAFELRYAKGKLTGTGQFNYKKGKLAGNVTVNLSEKHKLSGGGELSYEIAPGLVAFAGLQIKEDGTTKISGGLRVPETIDLFPIKKIEKSLFKFPHIEIPILAIPLGTRSVGIVATIDGELLARAGIGPGQLRKVKLLAEIDPSKEESAFAFHASAELYVPAFAELAVSVSGGIGVSLAIVRAVGGINAEAAAGIKAEFIAAADLKYDSGQFAVSGKVELAAQPRLIFRLNAFVKVEADLFITTIELYEKKWQLAAFEYGSNLRFGLRMPFKYVFGKPFELSLDQIEFIKPEINTSDLLKSLLPK